MTASTSELPPARDFLAARAGLATGVIALGIVLVLKTVFALKAFDTIFTLTNGGPGTSTQTLAYFVYHTAFNYYDMGYAAAAAWVLTALLWPG